MSNQNAPLLQATLPHFVLQHYLYPDVWKRALLLLNYHTYFKKKGETHIFEEPSHVKQLSLNHMYKLGLIIIDSIRNYCSSFTMSLK